MPPPNETTEKDKRDAEYRCRILAAARRLMDQNGFESVNMYQIAQEAGIGQGTLYRRYEHPGEIYSELLRTNIEQAVTSMEADFGQPSPDLSSLDQLRAVIARILQFLDKDAELLTCISCMYAGKKDNLPFKRPAMIRLKGLIRNLLERAVHEEAAVGIDITLYTHFLVSALAPEQYKHHRDELGYSQERYLAGFNRLFIDGLRKGERNG